MLNPYTILLMMAITGFVLGLLTFVTGLLILLLRPSNQDMKTLIAQTATLAQKGITEDIAGLVGHVSSLLEALNQMVRTTSGVGVLLVLLGLALMAGSSFIAYKVSLVASKGIFSIPH